MVDRQKRFLPNVKVLTFDTPSAMFLAVKSGQATAMQMDTPVIDWYAANNSELKTLPENLGNIQGNAIFMKPGDFTLWLWIDTDGPGAHRRLALQRIFRRLQEVVRPQSAAAALLTPTRPWLNDPAALSLSLRRNR